MKFFCSRSSVTSSDSENAYNSESGSIRPSGSRDRLGPGVADKQCVHSNSSGRSSSIISDRTCTSERTDIPDRTNTSERTHFSDRTSDHENNVLNCTSHSRQVSASSEHSQFSSRGDNSQMLSRGDNSQKPVSRTNCDQSGVPSHCYGGSTSSVHSSSSQSSSQRSGSQENLIDSYASLPRTHVSKKPPEIKSSESEVYKAYLNKQKSLQNISQVQHLRTSSGSSTANSIEGSDSSGRSDSRKKMSQSEIRELLEKNYVQRHQSQISQWTSGKSAQGKQYPDQNRTIPNQGQVQPGVVQGQISNGANGWQMAAQYQGHQSQNGCRERNLYSGNDGQGYITSDYSAVRQQGQAGGYQQNRLQQTAFQGEGHNAADMKTLPGEVGRNFRNHLQAASGVPDRSAQYGSQNQTQIKDSKTAPASSRPVPVPSRPVPVPNRPQVPAKNVGQWLPSMAHSVSNNCLNMYDMTPRPLERCSSQPDCQKLVESPFANTPGTYTNPLCNETSLT